MQGELMTMVIYSASPLIVFQQSFLIAGGLFVAGAIGVLVALFWRLRRRKNWLGLGISSVILGAIGIVMLGVTVKDMSTSTQTITARLDQKSIVQQSCEEQINCNNDYVLSMLAAPKAFDFTVSEQVYASAQKGMCYQVTFYPSVGLFGANTGTTLYVATSYITNITRMDQNAC
jgi:hypothetical protein